MRRSRSIKALLSKCRDDSSLLAAAYDASRAGRPLGDNARVLIKNTVENLLSCLDYMAQDVFGTFCTAFKKPKRLYFPIWSSAAQFKTEVDKSFPGLELHARSVFDLLEAVQPYNKAWLGQFNKLNNYNKHEDLSEPVQVDGRRVTMRRGGAAARRRGGGMVAIGPAIEIAPDASFFGVRVDPVTRLPPPNSPIETTVEPWSNFYFEGIDGYPITVFVGDCTRHVEELFAALDPLV